MARNNWLQLAALGAVLLLSACGSGSDEPRLMFLKGTTNGPDEFSIIPTKPLSMPPDLAQLPTPTPGGTNITDPTPFGDATAALGGNIAVKDRAGTDQGLVAYAARKGTDANIRTQLASEDLQWRRDNEGHLLEKLFKVTVYYKAYAPMELDQDAEIEYWRKRGVKTPSAPPPAGLLE